MLNFCTYFNFFYLPRALALYRSLNEHCPEFILWVLCMDKEAYNFFVQHRLPNIIYISLEDFERNDEQLSRAKQNRSLIEYYFTCTPSLPLYIFKNWPAVDLLTYLDADLFFFANPAGLFDEIGAASIAIIGHRFPPAIRYMEYSGIYNVGWLSFRRDEIALSCLRWWRDRCLEWCYDRKEDGRFADQKYLDDWPQRFRNVAVLEHKGANLAPWNLANYRLTERRGFVWVDEQPLIFFHFHGLTKIFPFWFNPHWNTYKIRPNRIIRKNVYSIYIHALSEIQRQLLPYFKIPSSSENNQRWKTHKFKEAWLKQFLRRLIARVFCISYDLITGNFIIHLKGLIT